MNSQANWYMPKRIVYVTIADDFWAGDIRGLDDSILSHLRQGCSPEIHVIIDASQVKTLPPGFAGAHFSYLHHPRLGWNIFIAPEAIVTAYQARRALPPRCRSFTSLEEGLFFLEDEDASLLMPA